MKLIVKDGSAVDPESAMQVSSSFRKYLVGRHAVDGAKFICLMCVD